MNDERVDPRFEVDATIFIEVGQRLTPDDTGEIVICNSLDISSAGLQVILDQGIGIGRAVRVCLDIRGRDPIFAVANVVWQNQANGTYHHGLKLLDVQNTDFSAWQKLINELSSELVTS